MTDEISAAVLLLGQMRALNTIATRNVTALVENHSLIFLTKRYELGLLKRNVDLGLNLFAIITDFYHRENFHSDILKALIDPKGKHDENDKYLRLFLQFIQTNKASVDLSHYRNSRVEREENRVDLLIADDDSKHAVIVENKINNAADQERQLPRYLELVTASGYTCDAIIYLRVNGYVGPDKSTWTTEDNDRVMPLLKVLCAYDDTEADLLHGWVQKSEEVAQNPDAKHILRQYAALIRKLGGNVMNKPIMEQFFKTMLEGENLKTAQSLKAMLDELAPYRAQRIVDEFQGDLHPFQNVNIWSNVDAYFTGCFRGDAHLGFDVWVNENQYTLCFWDRNDKEGQKGIAEATLREMGCLDDFYLAGGQFKKLLGFPSQEAELFGQIRAFKKRLAEVLRTVPMSPVTNPL